MTHPAVSADSFALQIVRNPATATNPDSVLTPLGAEILDRIYYPPQILHTIQGANNA